MKKIKRIFILDKKYRIKSGEVGRNIIAEFEKRLDKVEALYTEDNLLFDLTGDTPELISVGEKVQFNPEEDFVFDRYSGVNIKITSLLSVFLKRNKIQHSFEQFYDFINRGIKHYQYLDLKFRGVPIPKTFVASGKSILFNYSYIKSILGKELVVKADGSQGKFVVLVKNKKQLQEFIHSLDEKKQKLIAVQEKVNPDFDIRMIFMKNKVLSAMKRSSESFLNNFSQGGSVEKYIPTKKDIQIAKKAIKGFGLDYVGVDIMYDTDSNPVIIEIQALPQTNGMRLANPDINLGKEIVDRFLSK